MSSEEQKLLINVIEQFAKSELESVSLKIEKEGLPRPLVRRLAELGLLAATVPPSEGGSGIDVRSFSLILYTIAKYSPSVAYYIYVQNTLVNEVLHQTGRSDLIPTVASGEITGTMVHDINMNSQHNVKVEGTKLQGENEYVVLPSATYHIVLARSSERSLLVLAKPSRVERKKPLGLRALEFGVSFYDSEVARENVLIQEKAEEALARHLDSSSIQVGAIALGIAESAIDKAIEYSKQRRAFESYLYEFQPIAAVLSDMKSRIGHMKDALTASEGGEGTVMFKLHALEIARLASRIALQVHGGYGYLEDVGIERLYRDSMFLTLLTSNYLRDMKAASTNLISKDAFRI